MTRNWRLYLIRNVILPQRSKRIYLNTIHSIFSSDIRGLCSSNMLNLIVIFVVLILLAHAAIVVLSAYNFLKDTEQSGIETDMVDKSLWVKLFNIMLLLATSVYPLIICVLAVGMLL